MTGNDVSRQSKMDDSETNTETTGRFINAVAMRSVLYDYTDKNYTFSFFLRNTYMQQAAAANSNKSSYLSAILTH